MNSSVVGYDGGQDVREEGHLVDQKPAQETEQDFIPPPAEKRKSRWGFGGKTMWDWLELLIVPIVLSLITVAFTWQQNVHQGRVENERAEQAQKLENQRAENETLQTYLGQMGTLLLKENLRGAEEDSDVRTLARARTLTVLGRLGQDRKRTVIEFLYEASLINGDDPVIDLNDANLSEIDLSSRYLKDNIRTGDPNLKGINLSDADLSEADLRSANLNEADLSEANLSGADLRWAFLKDADLFRADLRKVDMSGATNKRTYPPNDLVVMQNADANVVSLQGANLKWADLRGADLSGADLSGSDFLLDAYPFLSGVDLSNADLREAVLPSDLPDVDLSGANLTGASLFAISTKKLARQAKSLEGATMPNGQKYEDWLKDSESRKEGAENK